MTVAINDVSGTVEPVKGLALSLRNIQAHIDFSVIDTPLFDVWLIYRSWNY